MDGLDGNGLLRTCALLMGSYFDNVMTKIIINKRTDT